VCAVVLVARPARAYGPAMRLRLTSAAVLLVAAAAPPVAHAVDANFDLWQGKTKTHKSVITLTQAAPGRALYAVLQVSCQDASGTTQAWTMQAHGVPGKSGKASFSSKKAINAKAGTLTFSGTALAHHRATGTIKWTLPAAYGGCTGHDTFNLKWSLSHGG
jgi:hypothetical protein